MSVADKIWGGIEIHEEWMVIDRWWTDHPTRREYRDITRLGRRRVEYRDETTGGEWQERLEDQPVPRAGEFTLRAGSDAS